jgi:hypothetical protein
LLVKKVGRMACCARISGSYTVYKASLRLLDGIRTLKSALVAVYYLSLRPCCYNHETQKKVEGLI